MSLLGCLEEEIHKCEKNKETPPPGLSSDKMRWKGMKEKQGIGERGRERKRDPISPTYNNILTYIIL